MTKYRLKAPVEALHWDKDCTVDDLIAFFGEQDWYGPHASMPRGEDDMLGIAKRGGGMVNVVKGDWIVRGVNGEFYAVKPDIFTETYVAVEE